MITQKDLSTSIDIILAFELWILILELSITGQQCLHVPWVKGVDSPRLLHSSRLCCSIFEWWTLIPRIIFWLAMPSYYSSHGYRFFDCFFILARSAVSLLE
jgi:hypothetical protein